MDLSLTERRRTKRKAKLIASFDSATSFQEMLQPFLKMKKSKTLFPESELGCQHLRLAQQLHSENQDPEKILAFGTKALQILIFNNTCQDHGIAIACNLYLLGSACYRLKRYHESLSYLEWCERNLVKLELDSSAPSHIVVFSLKMTHDELFRVKTALGRGEEAVYHLKKVLEVEEKAMDAGCVEIGRASMDVARAFMVVLDFKEALPFALRGLEIYGKWLERDSVELAWIRLKVVTIYSGLGEFDKAWEQNVLGMSVLKRTCCSSDLLHGDMEAAYVLLGLSRFEEGVDAFRDVISRAETQGAEEIKLGAFLSMAMACYREQKCADGRTYMELAERMLEKEQMHPFILATGLVNLSRLCEEMDDFRTAISLLLRALVIPELPQNQLICSSSRLFSMLYLNGCEEKQEISQLEDVVDRLKQKLGPEHSHVGYGYVRLGTAYMDLGKPGKAAKCFLLAKNIMDVSLGANHVHSLATSQSLSTTYAEMIRFDQATKIQRKVVEGFEGLGPDEQASLDEAAELLKRML